VFEATACRQLKFDVPHYPATCSNYGRIRRLIQGQEILLDADVALEIVADFKMSVDLW